MYVGDLGKVLILESLWLHVFILKNEMVMESFWVMGLVFSNKRCHYMFQVGRGTLF